MADLNNLDWVEEALAPTGDPGWVLYEGGYDPTREAGIEARFAIGNGLIGVRGSRSVSRGPTWTSYQHNLSWASWPRTYVAGLFDTPNTEPPVPALVPAPDWLRVRIWIDGKMALIRSGVLSAHHRWLDMRRGLMMTEWRQQWDDRVLHLRTLRFVSQVDRGLGGQLLQFELEGPPAELKLEASFEAAGSALECLDSAEDLVVWCTPQTRKTLAVASMAQLRLNGNKVEPEHTSALDRRWVWTSAPGQKVTVLRLAAFARGDKEDNSAAIAVQTTLDRVRHIGWRTVLAEHEEAWARRWAASDVEIVGDDDAQQAMRFAIYHLISAANPEDERVSIGARALTGDSYLGHVFWDTEIYLLPFYSLTWPEAARALLFYRYHTLSGARAKAARMGFRGAFFAWESADTGEETTPERIIDPNGRVIEVLCGRQEWHIVADVAYAVWQYWQVSADDAFILEAGAEILLETARFWASCAVLEGDDHYHIRGIIGPDEYHEHIDDNAYTNEMARWNLQRAIELLATLGEKWPARRAELIDALALDQQELALWQDVADRLIRHFDEETGLFEQFEGYFGLEEIDLSGYAGRTVPMDVVLGRERTQGSQVVKQADVVALLALQDAIDRRVVAANFRYYAPRCGHGSSLSHGLHGVVAARLGHSQAALAHFRETAAIDLGPATVPSAGGVRIAAQGGLWQVAILGFAGLRTTPQGLWLEPSLPASWQSLRFRVCWRGRVADIRIEQNPRLVTVALEQGEPLLLRVNDHECELVSGTPQRLKWSQLEPEPGEERGALAAS